MVARPLVFRLGFVVLHQVVRNVVYLVANASGAGLFIFWGKACLYRLIGVGSLRGPRALFLWGRNFFVTRLLEVISVGILFLVLGHL